MGETTFQEALQAFLRKSKFYQQLKAEELQSVWPEIVGQVAAKHTQELRIAQHVLYISTNVAPLRAEFQYQKETIKQRVNEALQFNLVKDVVVR
jgi:predicted nucleic acid-binding Zn ribbon protein